jgi:S-adenosylmethionine uptake transporter
MAWAVLLGAVFYSEMPDALAFVGLVLIACSGLFTFLREDKVSGWPKRTILMRDPP